MTAVTLAHPIADIVKVNRDLDEARNSLVRYFDEPSDREAMLRVYSAVESLLRAVATLTALTERQHKELCVLRGRVNQP